MSEIVESIKAELLKRCEAYKEKHGYDFWNDHIKYVVKNSIELANKYGADVEIVELGALLHDIAIPSEFGNLKKLKELVLDANQLATLPESLAECDSLETISVVENPLEGGIPRVLLDKKGLSIDQ